MNDARFAFGENWADYARGVTEKEIDDAKAGLVRLLPDGFDPAGKTFLDIGCGSGLHSLAAYRLGFSTITAVDYDENSVSTTKALAARFDVPIKCFRDDILNTKLSGPFDVVYSWGVLHHTGDMAKAIENARSLLKPGGTFVIAIYRRSPMCRIWTGIKWAYNRSPRPIKRIAEAAYFHILRTALSAAGNRDYNDRGMDLRHDAVDWLGGYPYTSATPEEIAHLVGAKPLKSFNTRPAPIGGLLGTGCAEYVFRAQP